MPDNDRVAREATKPHRAAIQAFTMKLRAILRQRGAAERVVLMTDRVLLTRGCIIAKSARRDVSEYYTNVYVMGQTRPHLVMFIKWHLRTGKILPALKLPADDLPKVLAAIGEHAAKRLEPAKAHSKRGLQIQFKPIDEAEAETLAEAVYRLFKAEILEYERSYA